jgi:hypothetical protein
MIKVYPKSWLMIAVRSYSLGRIAMKAFYIIRRGTIGGKEQTKEHQTNSRAARNRMKMISSIRISIWILNTLKMM